MTDEQRVPYEQEPGDHTPTIKIRTPRAMWDAYGRVCDRLGMDRTEDLLARMRERIERHGDDTDRAGLAAADAELAERRARKGGRPRKASPAGATDDGRPGDQPA
jgi:hypothetical protein